MSKKTYLPIFLLRARDSIKFVSIYEEEEEEEEESGVLTVSEVLLSLT